MASRDDRIKKRQQVPNVQVKDAAEQYEAASQVLYRHLEPGAGLLLPFLNVTIMSVELYLKTLCSSSVHHPIEEWIEWEA